MQPWSLNVHIYTLYTNPHFYFLFFTGRSSCSSYYDARSSPVLFPDGPEPSHSGTTTTTSTGCTADYNTGHCHDNSKYTTGGTTADTGDNARGTTGTELFMHDLQHVSNPEHSSVTHMWLRNATALWAPFTADTSTIQNYIIIIMLCWPKDIVVIHTTKRAVTFFGFHEWLMFHVQMMSWMRGMDFTTAVKMAGVMSNSQPLYKSTSIQIIFLSPH